MVSIGFLGGPRGDKGMEASNMNGLTAKSPGPEHDGARARNSEECDCDYTVEEGECTGHGQRADMPSHKYDDKVMKQEKIRQEGNKASTQHPRTGLSR